MAEGKEGKIIRYSMMTPEEQERMMNMLRTAFDVAFANAESDGIDDSDIF